MTAKPAAHPPKGFQIGGHQGRTPGGPPWGPPHVSELFGELLRLDTGMAVATGVNGNDNCGVIAEKLP